MDAVSASYSQYITSDFLTQHSGVGKVLEEHEDFVTFLNENLDYAQMFSESAEGAKQAVQAAYEAGAIEESEMGILSGDASLTQGALAALEEIEAEGGQEGLTEEWLAQYPEAAQMLSQYPEVAEFLANNPEYAQMFMESPEGALEALGAALENIPDAAWSVDELMPGNYLAQTAATEETETGAEQSEAELTQGEQTEAVV